MYNIYNYMTSTYININIYTGVSSKGGNPESSISLGLVSIQIHWTPSIRGHLWEPSGFPEAGVV